jgi:class 3 adenylate cyclase/CHASE2 domain-containing sensor protein
VSISSVRLKRLLLLIVIVLAGTAAAMLAVRQLAFVTQAEQFISDVRVATLLTPEPQDPDLVIAAITEDTLAQFPYRSPVDREFLANLIETLEARGPSVILIDVLFDQPTEAEKDAHLREVLAKASVSLVVGYEDNPQIVNERQKAYLDGFVPAAERAYAELPEDPASGTARWIYPGKRQPDGSYIMGFARAVAAKLGIETPDTLQEIIWHGRPDRDTPPFRSFPAHFVSNLPADWFKGKVVLIGATISLTDRSRTPFATVYSGDEGVIPGIEIHAHAISQLLSGKRPYGLTLPGDILLTLSLAALGLLLGVRNMGLGVRIGVALAALLALWGAGFGLFHYTGYMIPLVEPSLAFLLTTWGGDALTGREARRQREFIQGAFSRYLSPLLVKQLADSPQRLKLGGEMRDMTLMFCDIRGFTTISERFDAHGLTHFINRFLTPMTDLIMASGGTIDKYMGDAIMAFWNAPLDDPVHVEHGCRAALAMRAELVRLNKIWREEAEAEGKPFADIHIGIGINTGVCCVGNVGSDQRFDYSVLGDDVNLASRLEGQSKTYGVDVVIGERTAAAVPVLAALELDLIRVKGKTKPVRVFHLLGDEKAEATSAFAALKVDHDALIAAYRGQRWAEARSRLEACRAQAPESMQAFYALYDERIAACLAEPPPADWDGVFVALTK